LYQLFDLLLVFTGIVAALLVVYLFRKSADKFIYASVAFAVVYGISMLFVINRNEFQRCLENDQLTYRIIRYTAMAVIFLATMVALAVVDYRRRKAYVSRCTTHGYVSTESMPQQNMGMPQQAPRPPQGVPGGTSSNKLPTTRVHSSR
jgi:hypothetical protein